MEFCYLKIQQMHYIDSSLLTINKVREIVFEGKKLGLSEEATSKIERCRTYLDEKVARSERLIYGVNTGFGSLCNTAISTEDLEQLQTNLVLSHACGTGEEAPSELVKRMILLKILGCLKNKY